MSRRGPRVIVFALSSLSRLSYHLSTIEALTREGHDVHLLFCRDRPVPPMPAHLQELLDALSLQNPNLRVIFEGDMEFEGVHLRIRTMRTKEQRARRFLPHLLRSYASFLRRLPGDSGYLRRWLSYLPRKVQRLVDLSLVRFLLRLPVTSRLLSAWEAHQLPDPGVSHWMAKVKPDAVVASACNTRYPTESEYLRAAASMGIATAVPVPGWDYLSTRGLLPACSGLVLVWNASQATEAREVHSIDANQVVVTGAPFFDRWFDRRDLLVERRRFVAGTGLDPDRPVLAWLGSSSDAAANEGGLVRRLHAALRSDTELHGIQLLVRPDPAHPAMREELQSLPGLRVVPSEVPIGDASTGALLNTLSHAFAVVGINTAGLLVAAALDRPCFSVRTEEVTDAVHLRQMLEAGAIGSCHGIPALMAELREVLRGRDSRSDRRRDFARESLRPRGPSLSAGEVTARAIAMLAEGRPADEIDLALAAQGCRLTS